MPRLASLLTTITRTPGNHWGALIPEMHLSSGRKVGQFVQIGPDLSNFLKICLDLAFFFLPKSVCIGRIRPKITPDVAGESQKYSEQGIG